MSNWRIRSASERQDASPSVARISEFAARPYHGTGSKIMSCEAFRANNSPWTMGYWNVATGVIRLTTTDAKTPIPAGDEATYDGLKGPYATTCAPTPRGTAGPRGPALQRFGVSRHTLGRFMERGHPGRSLPGAVIKAIGDAPDAIAAAVMGQAATDAGQSRFK